MHTKRPLNNDFLLHKDARSNNNHRQPHGSDETTTASHKAYIMIAAMSKTAAKPEDAPCRNRVHY
jgi:hypothetical protein